MAARTHLATLPGPGPEQRLQVALVDGGDGRLKIDLREQHFAEGIGWFDQRTLVLEPEQFKRLQAVLGLKADHTPMRDERPATLAFPVPAEPFVLRAAVGGGT
jgi:hypothetical protein